MSHIIEFAGPPGSGKTTRCNYFIKQLRQSGYQVAGRTELKQYLRSMNRATRWWLYAATVFRKTGSCIRFCMLLAWHRSLRYDALYRYLRWCLFDGALRTYIRRYQPDYVLLDQWALQDLWSATIFTGAKHGTLARQLKRFGGKRDALFYFDVDAQTAAARIGLRSSSISRFDAMGDGQRLEELRKWTGYLFSLFHAAECPYKKILSGHAPAARLANLFFYHLDVLKQRRTPVQRLPHLRYQQV